MRRWTGPLLVMTVIALFTHWLTLNLAPSVIMDRAMAALEARGVALHRFTVPQRVTPQTQQIVRSSPDLLYALCRYDLSDPSMVLKVQVAAWPDYQSLSFFDAQTDNFATLRASGRTESVRLLAPGSAAQDGAITSPTAKGVILIRRLAPTAERFDAAVAVSADDRCELAA